MPCDMKQVVYLALFKSRRIHKKSLNANTIEITDEINSKVMVKWL